MRSEMFQWFVRGIGLAIGVGLVFAIANGLAAAARILVLVFVAILLASALEPAINWLRSRLPLGRGMTIFIVYLTFFAAVVALALLVVPGAISQVGEVVARIRPFLRDAREYAQTLQPAALSTGLLTVIRAAEEAIEPRPAEPGQIVEIGLTAAEAVFSLVTMLAIVFFWLTEHARLQRYALAFLPANRRAGARETWNEVETRLGSWVRGQLILMTTVGVALGVVYAVLGLESFLLLALIAGLAEGIPLVGPLIGAIPALLVAATRGPEMVLIVAVVYVIVQVIEGNVLVPLIMRNTIGISPFLVIVSILVGAAIGGIQGALLAVPVVAAVEVVLERLQARSTPVPQDPASVGSPDREAREAAQRSLPDQRDRTAVI